jgi:monovalent cation:H+ antiporter-2, CPA2 family
MHDLPLLINITLALVVAFIGGIVARRLGLPTIVGYLLAGIVIGPFTPGFTGDVATLQQLAELGVIFLMFGVGLHFSFADLWRVRDIAVPGALIQTALATAVGFALTRLWGWSTGAGIVLGLAISVASTVVLLRGLMDNKLLNTAHGQAAVGWLVMEDILSVLILVLMPALVAPAISAFNSGALPGAASLAGGAAETVGFDWLSLAITLLKAAAFVLIMFLVGARLIPWALERIAHTRSRELFILAILAITLGTAMGASELFGVSLALGAFVAGAIISQSHLSHQVGADVFAFREAFAVLFFVSVGMLVNPLFLWQNLGQVAALSALVIVGKMIIVILMGLFFPRPARTFLVIAVGLSQVGEFSFILGQEGVALELLSQEQYSLILAAALISITLNPFLYKLLPWLERTLRRVPGFWRKLEANKPVPEVNPETLTGHVVIIGYGRIGRHLVTVLRQLDVPVLVIEMEMEQIDALNSEGIATLYGDAANSEVITHAHLSHARALVTTTAEESATAIIIASARALNPQLPIIARASSEPGVRELVALGADRIIHPELEGGLEIVHHTLLLLGYPLREVHAYAEAVRRDQYEWQVNSTEEHRSLHDMVSAADSIEISWVTLDEASPITGKTLLESNVRARTGASVVALLREQQLIANPKSSTEFYAGDRLGLIGEQEQIAAAVDWLVGGEAVPGGARGENE